MNMTNNIPLNHMPNNTIGCNYHKSAFAKNNQWEILLKISVYLNPGNIIFGVISPLYVLNSTPQSARTCQIKM